MGGHNCHTGRFGTGTSDKFAFLTRRQFTHLLHGSLTNRIEPLDSGLHSEGSGSPIPTAEKGTQEPSAEPLGTQMVVG